MDTLHSGNALGTGRLRAIGDNVSAFANEVVAAENGVVTFAAAGQKMFLESAFRGNGAFTEAGVEGLSGKADFQESGRTTHKG